MSDAGAAKNDNGCPRCGQPFHCGADDPAPCPCTTFTLDAGTLAMLDREYRGCVCLRCLAELAQSPQRPRAEAGRAGGQSLA